MFAKDYEIVLGVRPGLTDPASFKYRNEGTLLKRAADPEREYVDHILPDKIRLAKNYVAEASLSLDIIIIVKTLLEAVGMEAAPIGNAILRRRRPLVVLIHLLLIVSSYYLAWSLRFDGAIPPREVRLFWQFLPWLLLLRASAFIPFRLYEGLWRYTSVSDAANILAAVVSSSVPFVILVRGMYGESAHPRSVFVIDALLLVGLACGVRLLRRAYHELAAGPPGSKVVIVGAGDTGEAAIRELKKNYEYRVVALLDDDSTKRGRRIHGVQVVGGCEDLPRVVAERRPSEVLIAIDDPPDVLLRDLGRMLEPFSVKLTRLSRPEWCGGPVRVELPPRMPERSAVTRPTPPARNRVDVQMEVRRQQCPRCGHAELRRSRARTVIERLRRGVSRERPFRCQECQWRGWLIPLDYAILDAGAPEATLPDLRSLDAAFPPPSERRDHPEPDLV